MDINNMELLNDSGLSSLSGFSYQIKVFILRLTQLQQGQRVEFETLDDVAVRSLSSKDSISDSCFKWKVDETSSIEVFQVKQTNVSESVRRQVLYNWLLAYKLADEIANVALDKDKRLITTPSMYIENNKKDLANMLRALLTEFNLKFDIKKLEVCMKDGMLLENIKMADLFLEFKISDIKYMQIMN